MDVEKLINLAVKFLKRISLGEKDKGFTKKSQKFTVLSRILVFFIISNLKNKDLNKELIYRWVKITNLIFESKIKIVPKIKEFYEFLLSIKNDMYLENINCDFLKDKSQPFIDFYEKNKNR